MAEEALDDIAGIDRTAKDRFELVAGVIAAEDARRVLELGVWEGGFAARTLRDCPGIETYWMLDPWRRLQDWDKPFNIDDGPFEAAFAKAMEATAFAEDRRRSGENSYDSNKRYDERNAYSYRTLPRFAHTPKLRERCIGTLEKPTKTTVYVLRNKKNEAYDTRSASPDVDVGIVGGIHGRGRGPRRRSRSSRPCPRA